MNWSHASLEPRAEYSADGKVVLHGRTIIAWLHKTRDGIQVRTATEVIGIASSNAEAMLMAIRHREEIDQ